ncbi:MAG: FAD binding domain-containing protein, partial [Planctomycetota bacterium]
CTGYAQILDAVSRCTPANTTSIAERYDAAPMLADFARLGDEPVHVNASVAVSNAAMQSNGAASSNGWVGNGHAPAKRPVEVHVPTDLANLLELRAARPAAKLVSGATDVGVQHNHGRIAPAEVIFTGRVPELCELAIDEGVLRTGAAVSWTRVEDAVRDRLPEYHAILERFGSPQVRNAGTLVGNFANASPIADSLPLHYVAGSTIELASQRGERSVPIADFYRGYKELDLAGDELIVAVRTPLPTESTRLKLYKVSNRRDMDISTVTLGVWLEVDADDAISAARLAVGGCGPTVVRLPEAESRLVGATLSLDALEAAGRLAREAVTPITDVRGGAEYRSQLVENLFAKCWHDLTAPEAVTA